MPHDIQDLLNLILELEARIIKLELARAPPLVTDEWYWDH